MHGEVDRLDTRLNVIKEGSLPELLVLPNCVVLVAMLFKFYSSSMTIRQKKLGPLLLKFFRPVVMSHYQ
jgi:hypothetical protein